jgi:DNA mismatch repair protein MLH3
MNVINQLDRKFILCAVDEINGNDDSRQESDNPRRMLVLVDQHAASERVRVEGFLRTLCHNFLDFEGNGSQSPDRVELDPPRAILLRRKEASILRSTQSILGRWCFGLSWPESKGCDQSIDQDEYEQFLVHSVPRVVSEKVRWRILPLCIVHPIYPFTSFSREMSSGISSKNTRLSRRLMVCYRL